MKYILKFFIILFTILCIGAFVSLFQNGIHLSFVTFWKNLTHLLYAVVNPDTITFQTTSFVHDTAYPVFPDLLRYYGYSLTILVAGVVVSLILAIALTVLTFYIPVTRRKFMIKGATLLEAVPDLFIIVMTQLLFIAIYKQTGWLVFQVVGAFERPYVLPLVTYSILPTIFLYRTLLIIFEEELGKPYVELARGKGLRRTGVLLRHVFRNSLFSLINHSKAIAAFMISNLIMLEILFNMRGMMWFVINHPTYEIATISIILLFIPLYVMEGVASRIQHNYQKGGAQG